MATYKHRDFLIENQSDIFDVICEQGTIIFYSGIYRCLECGAEIAIAERKLFPPCGHHLPSEGQPHTLWRLLVRAKSVKAEKPKNPWLLSKQRIRYLCGQVLH
jgi:DNA-directed RNA polymerase subunit RPC12/RpoP